MEDLIFSVAFDETRYEVGLAPISIVSDDFDEVGAKFCPKIVLPKS